mmetsp:Transcript_86630/g.151239  ORF Transcript_86630/g.151239 Transcript_86630/m.151239 type:complete len:520 (+) Transcript_86630:31-1590(+)
MASYYSILQSLEVSHDREEAWARFMQSETMLAKQDPYWQAGESHSPDRFVQCVRDVMRLKRPEDGSRAMRLVEEGCHRGLDTHAEYLELVHSLHQAALQDVAWMPWKISERADKVLEAFPASPSFPVQLDNFCISAPPVVACFLKSIFAHEACKIMQSGGFSHARDPVALLLARVVDPRGINFSMWGHTRMQHLIGLCRNAQLSMYYCTLTHRCAEQLLHQRAVKVGRTDGLTTTALIGKLEASDAAWVHAMPIRDRDEQAEKVWERRHAGEESHPSSRLYDRLLCAEAYRVEVASMTKQSLLAAVRSIGLKAKRHASEQDFRNALQCFANQRKVSLKEAKKVADVLRSEEKRHVEEEMRDAYAEPDGANQLLSFMYNTMSKEDLQLEFGERCLSTTVGSMDVPRPSLCKRLRESDVAWTQVRPTQPISKLSNKEALKLCSRLGVSQGRGDAHQLRDTLIENLLKFRKARQVLLASIHGAVESNLRQHANSRSSWLAYERGLYGCQSSVSHGAKRARLN